MGRDVKGRGKPGRGGGRRMFIANEVCSFDYLYKIIYDEIS